MTTVVVDTCLAVKWVITQQYTDQAIDLASGWAASSIDVLAPALFPSEVANTLYKYVHRGAGSPAPLTITIDEAKLLAWQVLNVVEIIPDDNTLIERALELALRWHRPDAYDALFAALAERRGCDFWTADGKFFNAVRHHCGWVRHVAAHVIAPPPNS